MIAFAFMAIIPGPRKDDVEDVSLALEVAQTQWARGDDAEALKWLRKAADAAFDGGDDRRGIELSKAAAEVAARLKNAQAGQSKGRSNGAAGAVVGKSSAAAPTPSIPPPRPKSSPPPGGKSVPPPPPLGRRGAGATSTPPPSPSSLPPPPKEGSGRRAAASRTNEARLGASAKAQQLEKRTSSQGTPQVSKKGGGKALGATRGQLDSLRGTRHPKGETRVGQGMSPGAYRKLVAEDDESTREIDPEELKNIRGVDDPLLIPLGLDDSPTEAFDSMDDVLDDSALVSRPMPRLNVSDNAGMRRKGAERSVDVSESFTQAIRVAASRSSAGEAVVRHLDASGKLGDDEVEAMLVALHPGDLDSLFR